ncbi:MAG: hypothetical protein ACSHX7_13395 [Luteolibacter sp.]
MRSISVAGIFLKSLVSLGIVSAAVTVYVVLDSGQKVAVANCALELGADAFAKASGRVSRNWRKISLVRGLGTGSRYALTGCIDSVFGFGNTLISAQSRNDWGLALQLG